MRSLTDAGVPVGVLVAPIIPFINDESMEHILEAAKAAGAHYASYTVLRLPWEVKTLFEDWLHAHFPDRAQRVLHRIEDLRSGRRNDPNFGSRMRGTGIWADLLRQRFSMAARKLGLNRSRLQLSCDQFMPPAVAGLDGAHDASSPFSHPRLARKRLQGSPCLDRWRRQRLCPWPQSAARRGRRAVVVVRVVVRSRRACRAGACVV